MLAGCGSAGLRPPLASFAYFTTRKSRGLHGPSAGENDFIVSKKAIGDKERCHKIPKTDCGQEPLVSVGGSRGCDHGAGATFEHPLASFAYFATWKSRGLHGLSAGEKQIYLCEKLLEIKNAIT